MGVSKPPLAGERFGEGLIYTLKTFQTSFEKDTTVNY
jgi:hypothetical protein